MSVASTATPATVAKALDAVADAVLAMAAASPRPTMQRLATSVQGRFGIEASPDNLRMWIARRHADAVRAKVEPAVSCPLDDHLELVNELRDPARNSGRVYIWTQVLEVLKGLDPALADYTPEGLRSWYSRRARRADKAQATAARAIAGRDSLAVTEQHLPAAPVPMPVAVDAPAIPVVSTTVDPVPAPAPAPAPAVAACQDAQRAAATEELERLRGQGESELGGLLGKFLPQASQ
jgi:hypothetical protein